MKTLEKQPNRPFVILNLTDTHLTAKDIENRTPAFLHTTATIRTLVDRVKPDLITHTGDLSSEGSPLVFDFYAQFVESFATPWAFVWGNHDAMYPPAELADYEARMMAAPHCLYERGSEALGFGNYTLGIVENGRPVEALFFMDSHDRVPYGDELAWSPLSAAQLAWYGERVSALKQAGYPESALFLHIPPYSYRAVAEKHFEKASPEQGANRWVNKPLDALGEQNETPSSYPSEDGVLDALVQAGHTKLVVCGHCHVNNWMIAEQGVRHVFSLKTGSTSYHGNHLNGGTVITVGDVGVESVRHEGVFINTDL